MKTKDNKPNIVKAFENSEDLQRYILFEHKTTYTIIL